MLSGHSVGTYQRNELTRNSAEYACVQLSQLAEPLWTDPGLKSEIGAQELISTFLKRAGGEPFIELYHKILACEEKKEPS